VLPTLPCEFAQYCAPPVCVETAAAQLSAVDEPEPLADVEPEAEEVVAIELPLLAADVDPALVALLVLSEGSLWELSLPAGSRSSALPLLQAVAPLASAIRTCAPRSRETLRRPMRRSASTENSDAGVLIVNDYGLSRLKLHFTCRLKRDRACIADPIDALSELKWVAR
jgi:hypothetical protein